MKTCPKCGEVIEKLMGKWWCENCVEEVRPKTKKLQWLGSTTCDICGAKNQSSIVDGRTKNGQWAVMCLKCHRSKGVGLGTGRGQVYVRQADGTYIQK